ncbi:DUF3081 family protein [Pseudoalteromonas sp. SSDWG2]|uniref:DUF3081 family protein n=1 Tax=Pseudoalteromonas sp. SSDWG2 TaxID=3139391 RepID=UPI003BAB98D9
MKNDIDTKTLLNVYEHIQKHGEQTDKGKLFEGLYAYSDTDGYTVYLEGSGVILRFGFHNTYHLDYQHEKNKEDFMKKLESIAHLQ